MATEAQILANRENATHSTGPKTENGKAASSGNALTHGATSKRLLIEGETQEQFDALRTSVLETANPKNELEITLATNLAIALWRLTRMQRIEAAFLENRRAAVSEANPNFRDHPDAALAAVFADEAEARKMSLILRYVTSAERTWRSISKELEKAQRTRRAHEQHAEMIQATTQAASRQNEHRAEVLEQAAAMQAERRRHAAAEAGVSPYSHLPRSERRALERAQRKADKRALRQNGFVSQFSPELEGALPQAA